MTNNPFPDAAYQPEIVNVDKDGILDLIAICEENTRELLESHLFFNGETSTKHKLTANLYRGQLAKCEQLKKSISS